MKSRILVAVVGVPVLVWVVLWAPMLVMMAALALLAGIGAGELMKCVGVEKGSPLMTWTVIAAVFSVDWYYERPNIIAVWWLIYVVVTFIYAILKAGEVKFVQCMAGVFGVVLIPYSFSAFLRLEAADIPRPILLLPFIFSFACDTFAYFAGRAFGKHKLAPKVSPKKTIEGSIGGMLGNVLAAVIFTAVIRQYFMGDSFIFSYQLMCLLGLLCSIVAQVGDLSFSLIKREFGVKDYGHLFLEHGGVLDRFDSVLFVTPVIETVLVFALRLF